MILAIGFVYNERPYLPDQVQYLRGQGIIPYYIDNMSDDGTHEWLLENDVCTHQFDTGGSFHLQKLLDKATDTVHNIKPEWVIYSCPDLFYFFDVPSALDFCERNSYNQITVDCYFAKDTGEDFGLPLYKNYKRGNAPYPLTTIAKYDESFKFCADYLYVDNANPFINPAGVV